MDAQWVGIPASLVGAPHHRFRIFILAHRRAVPNPARVRLLPRRESPKQVRAQHGTIALSHQIIDYFALNGPNGSPVRCDESETLWSLIGGVFESGDATPTPSLDGSTSPNEKPLHPCC